MADDSALEQELARSRETSVRLLRSFAEKMGVAGGSLRVRSTFLESLQGKASRAARLVAKRPALSILIGVAAGFLVARALRSR